MKTKKSIEQKKIDNTNLLREDPIFNKLVKHEKTKAKVSERSSVFNFTINSNSSYSKMTNEDKLRFKNFIDYVFDEDRVLDFIYDRESPDNPRKNIKRVAIDYYFENSGKNLLHVHGLVRIKHHGFLRTKLTELRAFARKVFGKNVHIDLKGETDFNTSWENYIKKGGIPGKQQSSIL